MNEVPPRGLPAGVSGEEVGTWVLNLSIASSPSRWVQKRSNPAVLPEDTASPTFTRRCCSAQVGSVRFPRCVLREPHTSLPIILGKSVPQFRPESESTSKSHASQNVRRGRRSMGAAACPCSRTDSNKSVSTSTSHICVNAEACGCAGLARLHSVQTHGLMHARALTHSHPKLPPGWRKPLRIGQQSRHSRPGGRETSQSCFLFFFSSPPYRFI
ncbi:uncharacterized protein LOC131383427 [Hylobates moloch]|uniref:uncharacterized protein LOC131383427 n=1 Tax=Hylobates moloch TaxID=81572 RepID=UPI002675888D|nr:uncharacterized protein LOC131383427 [Hylobates moloch]